MTKIFRYCFTILAVLCAAAIIPVGALLGWIYALFCALGMALFAVLLMLFKDGIPFRRKPRQTDFMNSDEENAEILAEREKVGSHSADDQADDGLSEQADGDAESGNGAGKDSDHN